MAAQPPSKQPAADSRPGGGNALSPARQQAMASKGRDAVSAADDEESEEEADGALKNSFLLFTAAPSWLTSMLVHMVLLLVLALITITPQIYSSNLITFEKNDDVEEIEEFEEEVFEVMDAQAVNMDMQSQIQTQDIVEEVTDITPADDLTAVAVQVELSDFGEKTAPKNDIMVQIGAMVGSGLSGRGAEARGRMVRKGGGSAGSEAAVALALKWLANHQMPDGGWNFDHRDGQCQGRCPNHGNRPLARTGATAMALLPFLGAGQTHKQGKYKQVVSKGLYFLVGQRMKAQGELGDMTEAQGLMYSHGLAAIVLCEAYGMTQDRELMRPAQMSLNFISHAQDPNGGGWRYGPKEPGDTSVVGWQLMALKSGHMAYLQVNPDTIKNASKFLDSVQANSGAHYGYKGPGVSTATTAIGLLCRMYLGWKKDHPALQHGVEWLSREGPSASNMYYNYYATQVMRHYDGEPWKRWNSVMRDQLVNSQARIGHMAGSWTFNGSHSGTAGRVYCTSLATMILEVYYRHMPIYRQQAADEEFPL